MGSIYQKRGWWYYSWSVGGIKHCKAIRTKDEATAKRAQRLWDGQVELGRLGLAPKKALVTDTITQFMEQKSLRDTSRVKYGYISRSWLEWLASEGVETWDKLTDDHVTRYAAVNLKRFAARSVASCLTWLKSLLWWLWRKRQISEVPVREWPKVSARSTHADRTAHYSKDEVSKLREHFKGSPFELIFLFSLLTGARLSEVRAARVSDVRVSDNVVVLRNVKTEQGAADYFRALSIHPDLLRDLSARAAGVSGDFLFPEIHARNKDWATQTMKRACRTIGITYRRFHGLRHTFVTYLLASGADIRQVMAAAGHKRLETTQIYAHLAEKIADTSKLGI